MPTYAYNCLDQGHHVEVHQSFDDDPLTTCPECGGMLRKQFSAVGVVFKGSGFYRTDSRNSRSSSAASTTSTTPSTSSTKKASSESGASSKKVDAPAAS